MEQEFVWVLKTLILPPGGVILLGLIGLSLGRRFLGRLLIVIALAALYIFSTPFFANKLMAGLETYPALSDRAIAGAGAQAIVVLGGGLYSDAPEYGSDTANDRLLLRLRYAAWLSRRSGLPVIPSGGSAKEGGLPEARIAKQILEQEFGVRVTAVEDQSRTTWDNARMTRKLLEKMGIGKVLLVTQAWHMPRALASFRQAGVDVIPAPTVFYHKKEDPEQRLSDWLPDPTALLYSYFALHEYLGRAWYQIREL